MLKRTISIFLSLILILGMQVSAPANAQATTVYAKDMANGIWTETGGHRYITFGSFNGQPIRWRVLEVYTSDGTDDNNAGKKTAFLLADDVLRDTEGKTCEMPFNSTSNPGDGNWVHSSIRSFLNSSESGQFLNSFSTDEQAAISVSHFQLGGNSDYTHYGGFSYATTDAAAVYLPSRLVPDNEADYIAGMGDLTCANAQWWFRSPGVLNTLVTFVDQDGSINGYGDIVTSAKCVRPVIRVDLTAPVFATIPVIFDALDYTVTITGKDGTTPICGARVEIDGYTRTTDSDGKAQFELPADDYNVIVTAPGYLYKTQGVTVSASGQTDTISLDTFHSDNLLTGGSGTRITQSSGTIAFYSETAGTLFYKAVTKGQAAPSNIAAEGTAGGAVAFGPNSGLEVALPATDDAADVYVVVEDASGNVSDPLKIAIARFITPLSWRVRHTDVTGKITKIAYGNGVFAATTDNGYLLTSKDNGSTWTSAEGVSAVGPHTVVYNGSKFFAAGKGILSSVDGTTWINALPDNLQKGNYQINTLMSDSRIILATGPNSTILESADGGASWTKIYVPNPGSVTFNKFFYVGGTDDKYVGLADGTIYTLSKSYTDSLYSSVSAISDSVNTPYFKSLSYTNGIYYAIKSNGYTDELLSSSDLRHWSAQGVDLSASVTQMIYDGPDDAKVFLGVANQSFLLTSRNGTDWTQLETGYTINNIDYQNGIFIAVGNLGTVKYSADGFSWNSCSYVTDKNLYSIGYGEGIFILGGEDQTILSPVTSSDFSITSANNASFIAGTGGTFQVITNATGSTPITFSLTGAPSGVSISGSGLITVANTVPTGNYPFTIKASNGVQPDSTQNFTLTITSPAPQQQFTITASHGPDGQISPYGSIAANRGESKTFYMMPYTRCIVSDVIVDGSSVGAVPSYTFTNITADHTIRALFTSTGIHGTPVDEGSNTPSTGSPSGNGSSSPPSSVKGSVINPIPTTDSTGKTTSKIGFLEMTAAVDNALNKPNSNGTGVVSIQFTAPSGSNSSETTIEKSGWNALAASSFTQLVINDGKTSLKLDSKAIKSIGSQAAGDVKISVGTVAESKLTEEQKKAAGGHPVYDFTIMSGDKKITDFGGGKIQISVPYTLRPDENPNAIVIYYLNENGEMKMIPNGKYDPNTGTVTFSTAHFSKYAIGYNSVPFTDIPGNYWGKADIEQAAARRLVAGAGNKRFLPDKSITRAEFVQMVANVLELPAARTETTGYSDVNKKAWYFPAILKAKSAGILDKFTGDKFLPDQLITREEMAVVLAPILKQQGIVSGVGTIALSAKYKDEDQINKAYSEDIMAVTLSKLMSGAGDGKFDPKGPATRAQAVTIQMRLLELLNALK